MKVIINAHMDNWRLALLAAKRLYGEPTERKTMMVSYDENRAAFYVKRNGPESISVSEVKSDAECSGVQLNSPQGHTVHETAPDAQRNAANDAKSP